MFVKLIVKWCLLITCILYLTACGTGLYTASPTINFSASTTELSITRGSEGSIFFNLSGTNVRESVISINFISGSEEEEQKRVTFSFANVPNLWECKSSAFDAYCFYNGPLTTLDINQLEFKFHVPQDHRLTTATLDARASVRNGPIPTGTVEEQNFSVKLNLTD